jgi:hypothetical protein
MLVAFLLVTAVGCLTPVADIGESLRGASGGGNGSGGGSSAGTGGVACEKHCPIHSRCDPATTVDGRCLCDPGYDTLCYGRCVDLFSDPSNCGSCGNTCPCDPTGYCSTCFASNCR